MELNKKTQPLVTVIIPLYNAEMYISETIESVISQTYQNWEMIVVDDCSTDNSREIVKKYEIKDNRIKLIESETNFGGPAKPRNIGIDNAKGEYVAFLDADDVWYVNKLSLQIKYMIDRDLDISSTLSNKIDKNSNKILTKESYTNKEQKILNSKKNYLEKLLQWNFIALSSSVVRKEKIIHFDENKNLIAVEDYRLWLSLISNNIKFELIKEYLLDYRVLQNSISHNNSLNQDLKTLYCILDFILESKQFNFINLLVKKVILKTIKNLLNRF